MSRGKSLEPYSLSSPALLTLSYHTHLFLDVHVLPIFTCYGYCCDCLSAKKVMFYGLVDECTDGFSVPFCFWQLNTAIQVEPLVEREEFLTEH